MSCIFIVLSLILWLGGSQSLNFVRDDFPKRTTADSQRDQVGSYSYNYAVNDQLSGVYISRWEERSGDSTKGAYSLLDPGGYVRTVDYEVNGDSGFKETISNFLSGNHLLSTQQYLRSLELHPQPPLELEPILPDHFNDNLHTFNYHAMYAEQSGHQKLFGATHN